MSWLRQRRRPNRAESGPPNALVLTYVAKDVEGLIHKLRDQEEPAVERLLAAAGIGRFRGSEARDSLVGQLRDSDLDVRIQCLRSLGKLGDRSAVPALLERLEELEPGQEYRWALATLAALGAPEAQPPLLRELTTGEFAKRRWMAHCLGAVGSSASVPALRQAARADSLLQRRWYRRAVRRIRRRESRS